MCRRKLVPPRSTVCLAMAQAGLPDSPSLLQALRQIRSHLLAARLRQPSSEDRLQLQVVFVPCCPPRPQSQRRGSRRSALTCTYTRCIHSRLGKASANTLFMHLLNGFGSGDQCEETPKCSEKLKKPRSVDLPDQSVAAFEGLDSTRALLRSQVGNK